MRLVRAVPEFDAELVFESGARTLWLGLQEIAFFVEGACYAREFSEAETCV